MPISNFVKRKLATLFYLFDRDKDGVLEEVDVAQLGRGGGLPGSERPLSEPPPWNRMTPLGV